METRSRVRLGVLAGILSALLALGSGSCVILNKPPIALFTIEWLDNFTIEFDASLSSDPDGQIVVYEWNFGNGTMLTSSFAHTRHHYSPGAYIISLKVTDNKGTSARWQRDIVVVPEMELSFKTVGQHWLSQVPDPLEIIVKSQPEWEKLQRLIPTAVPADVDFSRGMIVGVFLGARPYADYSAQVTSMVAKRGRLTILYEEIEPGSDCTVHPMISYPFHIVMTERVDLPAIFVKESKVQQC